jgi:hypothetical protein
MKGNGIKAPDAFSLHFFEKHGQSLRGIVLLAFYDPVASCSDSQNCVERSESYFQLLLVSSSTRF